MSIKVENATKTFGSIRAVDSVSLEFEKGKIYGLLGRNGAGKTTLLNLISNRLFADDGRITVNGMDVCKDNSSLSNIFMVGEKPYYPEGMRVRDTFRWSGMFHKNFDTELAYSLAAKFELDTNKKIRKLSTGYKTVFRIINALALDLDYILLDEPILGLDAYHRDLFYKELVRIYAEKPRTFIISTHLIDEVSTIIEHVIIINEGKILKDVPCDELLDSGFTVTGGVAAVDEFTSGMNVIGSDSIGNIKSVYVLGDGTVPNGGNNVEISGLDLQRVFIKLTEKGGLS